MLNYSVSKMFILPDAGALKGFADLVVGDELTIKGLRIIEGKKGLFVTMPREQGKDSKWYDQVVCNSAETFDHITDVVLEHYNKQK
jgi:stage V sporulation protein G